LFTGWDIESEFALIFFELGRSPFPFIWTEIRWESDSLVPSVRPGSNPGRWALPRAATPPELSPSTAAFLQQVGTGTMTVGHLGGDHVCKMSMAPGSLLPELQILMNITSNASNWPKSSSKPRARRPNDGAWLEWNC
jgi:hypothetical protein